MLAPSTWQTSASSSALPCCTPQSFHGPLLPTTSSKDDPASSRTCHVVLTPSRSSTSFSFLHPRTSPSEGLNLQANTSNTNENATQRKQQGPPASTTTTSMLPATTTTRDTTTTHDTTTTTPTTSMPTRNNDSRQRPPATTTTTCHHDDHLRQRRPLVTMTNRPHFCDVCAIDGRSRRRAALAAASHAWVLLERDQED
ncbi:hypothetical protein BDZ89DRAFT_1111250 [Hymenopellis radicata]|nr:hypothetical protein BDZ89DRAFT_1111250 [Hymenopellis radicata]